MPTVPSLSNSGDPTWFSHRLDLFGNSRPWNPSEWVSQDDRLRGGSSVSHLNISAPLSNWHANTAAFYGNLNATTLGGSGFASQRTVEENKRWNLADFEGLNIVVEGTSNEGKGVKVYTIVIKDCIIRGEPDAGTEINWEWDFKLSEENDACKENGTQILSKFDKRRKSFYAPFSDFKPYYRGRLVEPPPAKPLDASHIKRFNLMVRSFFKEQEGPFELTFVSISAVTPKGKKNTKFEHSTTSNHLIEIDGDEDGKSCPGPGASSSPTPSSAIPQPTGKTKRSQKQFVRVTPGSYYDEYDETTDADARHHRVGYGHDHEKADAVQRNSTGWWHWLCGWF